MIEETVAYEIDDESFDLHIARPDAGATRPAVLICHAWEGRGEHEEDSARKLAELGYVGAAVDLYGVGKRGVDPESCEALMMPLVQDGALLRSRLTTALESVRGVDGVDSERMAIIGYCFGGFCSILAARMGLPLRAAVSFHGDLTIPEPLDAKVSAPILVLHGQDDPLVATEDLGPFALEMQRIHADWQFHAYPGAAHSFTIPTANAPDFGTVYDAEADRRSWSESESFLAAALA